MSEDLLFNITDVACVRAWKDEGWGPIHKRLLTMCIKIEQTGWKRKHGMTQTQTILNHIRAHGSISQREAYMDYSVQSFTRRIRDLKEQGIDLVRKQKKHPTTGQSYSRYYIAPTKLATLPRSMSPVAYTGANS